MLGFSLAANQSKWRSKDSQTHLIMAVGVLQKYFYIVLTAQVMLSLINSLFTLTDNGAVIAIFGFFGAHRSSKYSLLAVCHHSNTLYTPQYRVLT